MTEERQHEQTGAAGEARKAWGSWRMDSSPGVLRGSFPPQVPPLSSKRPGKLFCRRKEMNGSGADDDKWRKQTSGKT